MARDLTDEQRVRGATADHHLEDRGAICVAAVASPALRHFWFFGVGGGRCGPTARRVGNREGLSGCGGASGRPVGQIASHGSLSVFIRWTWAVVTHLLDTSASSALCAKGGVMLSSPLSIMRASTSSARAGCLLVAFAIARRMPAWMSIKLIAARSR
ncbi:hypothetical protein CCZ27_09440 [Thauera sinica]|nr:hypothetical protein CCZ27_09440 [Thauera sp. K11]